MTSQDNTQESRVKMNRDTYLSDIVSGYGNGYGDYDNGYGGYSGDRNEL